MPDSRSGDPGSKASNKADSPGRSTRLLQKIIIVTGTPGVGKTRLSKSLARALGYDYLNLGDLVKTEKLYRSYDRLSQSYIIDEKKVRRSLRHFFSSLKDHGAVIDTHWVGNFMPRVRGMVAVVVRLDPLLLARRLEARKWPMRKIWENVEAELIDLSFYESIKFLGPVKVYQIDSTGKSATALLTEAKKQLSSGRGWNRKTPDWLQRYDPIELRRNLC